MRTLTYYVATTIDGFIAAPDGSLECFPVTADVVEFIAANYPETLPTPVREQLGIDPEPSRFDIAIQGRGAYDDGLNAGVTSPFAHLRQYVVSRTLTQADPAVEIVSGEPVAKVRQLKAEDGKGIYLIGGSQLAGALLDEVDMLVVKVYPIVAGAGVPLFTAEFSPTQFRLTGSRALDSGVVILSYTRKRP